MDCGPKNKEEKSNSPYPKDKRDEVEPKVQAVNKVITSHFRL